jgi:ankyrin repeat protein
MKRRKGCRKKRTRIIFVGGCSAYKLVFAGTLVFNEPNNRFIVEDAGRQSISGSFNPIDEGEWSEQAYLGVMERLFNAIAAHDRAAVTTMIHDGIDVNRRDHVGRTPLQVAILSNANDIACDLVDANARMTTRLVDGRTALHLAAQLNLPNVVRKMLDRSAVNDEEAKVVAGKAAEEEARKKQEKENDMEKENEDEEMRANSDGDCSLEDEGIKKEKKEIEIDATADTDIIPEDADDEPDVFLVDTPDWDYAVTPLGYAVASGSITVVEQLLAASANPKLVTRSKHSSRYVHPLILTGASEDDDIACKAVEKLIAAGAITSEADDNLYTVLHRAIFTARPRLVSSMLKADPNGKAVLNIPWMDEWHTSVFPIASAINNGSYGVLAVLLAYGAKVVVTRDDFQRARDLK